MNKLLEYLQENWLKIIISTIIIGAGLFLLLHNAKTLMPTFSPMEIETQASSMSIKQIIANPVNAPFKILAWLPYHFGHQSVLWVRFIAAILGVASGLLFYLIINSLFSRKIAVFSSILFLSSVGFLQSAHLGSPIILQAFGLLSILSMMIFYTMKVYKVSFIYLSMILVAVLLYVPGLFWFIVLGGFYIAKHLRSDFKKLKISHLISLWLLVLIIIAPLIWAIILKPNIGLEILALPPSLPSLAVLVERAISLMKTLFWKGTGPAELMLIGSPLLNAIEIALLIIGLFVLAKSLKLKNIIFIFGAIILLISLIIFGKILNFTALTPMIYILIASGLFYLLRQWQKVFPVNPFARHVGTICILLLIASSSLYHMRQFYYGWPHSNATHAAFSVNQPTKY